MNPDKLRQIPSAPISDSSPAGGGGESAGTFAQAKDQLSQAAHDTAARLKSAAGETAGRARAGAQRLAQETKEDTANRIGGYSSAMHDSARSFEQQDPNIAWFSHRVADRLQAMADYVRNSDLDEMRRDAETLARRHPVAFFGGLFVTGLLIGNVLKAKPPSEEEPEAWDENTASGATAPDLAADTDMPEAGGI